MALALEYGSVSVNEMARELGISRTTISNYLHGRTQPRRGDLVAWSLRCGVPFDWLVKGDACALEDGEPETPKPTKSKPTKSKQLASR